MFSQWGRLTFTIFPTMEAIAESDGHRVSISKAAKFLMTLVKSSFSILLVSSNIALCT